MSAEALFDLSALRKIAIVDGSRRFVIECRPPGVEDWRAYFDAFSITSEQQGKQRVNTIDVDTPRVGLAEACIIDATGYTVPAGRQLNQIDNFAARLPLAHRKIVGQVLADVAVSSDGDKFIIYPEGEEVVVLDAVFTIFSSNARAMQKVTGLKHIFRTPTAAQHKRYSDAASRSVVVGGSRTAKTIYKGAQRTVCELYDELIVSVEGYGGLPLHTRELVIANMDLCHKFVAAQELFAPASTAAVAAEDEAE